MPGFEQEILDALNSPDPDIRAQAVEAAGNQDVAAAWPCILSILESPRPDKDLLLVAIGAAAAIRPEEASEVLAGFLESTNEEVVAATEEALAMARGLSGELEDEDRF
jgi:HEAT repeat protein